MSRNFNQTAPLPLPADTEHGSGAAERFQVEPIHLSQGEIPGSDAELDKFFETHVEEPLRLAARTLYERGVQTLSADAHAGSPGRIGRLTINYHTLSTANRERVKEIVAEDADLEDPAMQRLLLNEETVTLQVPLVGAVDDIAKRANETALRFEAQPMTWAPRMTFAQALGPLGLTMEAAENEGITPVDLGFHVGRDGYLYLNEDHARRALQHGSPTGEGSTA